MKIFYQVLSIKKLTHVDPLTQEQEKKMKIREVEFKRDSGELGSFPFTKINEDCHLKINTYTI